MNDSPEPLPFAAALKWNEEGLIAAIVQDAENGDVLMLAWMDEGRSGIRSTPLKPTFIRVRESRIGIKAEPPGMCSMSSQSRSIAMEMFS